MASPLHSSATRECSAHLRSAASFGLRGHSVQRLMRARSFISGQYSTAGNREGQCQRNDAAGPAIPGAHTPTPDPAVPPPHPPTAPPRPPARAALRGDPGRPPPPRRQLPGARSFPWRSRAPPTPPPPRAPPHRPPEPPPRSHLASRSPQPPAAIPSTPSHRPPAIPGTPPPRQLPRRLLRRPLTVARQRPPPAASRR